MSEGKKMGRPKGSKSISYTRFDAKKKRQVLDYIANGETVLNAVQRVQVSRENFYKTMKKDPVFKEKVELAKQKFAAKLETEFHNRIFNGSKEEVYDGEGNLVKRKVYDNDNLLLKALEVNLGDRYTKKSVNAHVHSHTVGDDAAALNKLASLLSIEITEEDINKKHSNSIEGEWEEKDE